MPDIKTVAIIGCGIGRSHIIEGYLPHPDRFRVVAVCDLDPARLAAIADEFAISRRTTASAEIMAMDDIDIVDICTPPATHYPLILEALAAGKHVICEKPLVGSLADVDRVIAAERTARGVLMPIFQYRYGDGAMKAKRIIEAGIAGKPYLGTVETLWKRTAEYYDNPWRGRWASELGGVLMTHAIHIHDLATFLMGPVSRIFARVATRVNAIEVEDCVSASWLMQSGALVSASATLGSQEEISRLRLAFENVTFESNHEAYAPGEDPWRIIPANADVASAIDALLADWRPVGRRFNGQMLAFHEALSNGLPPPVTSRDARQALEIVTAFYESAESGADVALPLAADHPKYRSWRPAA
ncbi:Gfo/Idh/MocA family oxidoreductase [Kaistia dalseonensis]|uniref:Dehydrogenase n=1 Tax=Kaistia dalseonensis TaxID=410840 RepID=A0ABU0H9V3_9HYPH|nr:Gfo/Idh/MocA family oxidoreductase [Kaistia dalseonensis]MCX5496482.1 Gfo/Idh/MocA family oxidoreductase [Kaistia dalseonensis]MDQ0439104.1 putative dehydrogenase [Kaistia dalseonensis]